LAESVQQFQRVNPLEALRANPFVLAPMAGITDHAFRTFMKKMNAGVVVTELVSATGIDYKSERTIQLMAYDECQRPVAIQLFGEDPETLARAAQFAEVHGADFVDLNFGCPVPKVTKKGAGSAMLRDIPQLTKVLREVKKAINVPLTIKIRTGWDSESRNAAEVIKVAADEGITWVAIHGRTRAQGYSGLADWDFIGDLKAKSTIPIIGNGDILSAKDAVQRLRTYDLDGVMIGRGALKDPYIFLESHALWSGTALSEPIVRDYSRVFTQLHEELASRCGEHILQIQLRKFAAWFATGYPGASQFRKNIFQSKSTDDILSLAQGFFTDMQLQNEKEINHEPFLMGGHG
jgi:tRNA-dihydrouridine synthase B